MGKKDGDAMNQNVFCLCPHGLTPARETAIQSVHGLDAVARLVEDPELFSSVDRVGKIADFIRGHPEPVYVDSDVLPRPLDPLLKGLRFWVFRLTPYQGITVVKGVNRVDKDLSCTPAWSSACIPSCVPDDRSN
jgi:hypothetical protein